MYETVSVKAVRAFYTAGCRLFFQDQTGTKYVWNRVKHVCCLMWFGIKIIQVSLKSRMRPLVWRGFS